MSLIGGLAGCGGDAEGVSESTIEPATIEPSTTTALQAERPPITADSSGVAAVTTTSVTVETSTTTDESPATTAVGSEAASIRPSLDTLDQADVDGLVWMREEEKLARDVYRALSEMWDLPIFANIAGAEQTHTDAVGDLLERYGIADPMVDDVPGVFENSSIQALYDDFVQQGAQSLVDALIVGATIEDLDIVDLRVRESGIAAIDSVYTNLEKGSRNHLRAFVTTLERRGGEYNPGYLTVEEYEAIIGSPPERGRTGA
jgi:hypothetical protein